MEASTSFDPFDFNGFGNMSIYKGILIQHIPKRKPKGIINYYRFEVIPVNKEYKKNHMDVTICNMDFNLKKDLASITDYNKENDLDYIHISSPVILPLGSEVYFTRAELDKDGNTMMNMIWLSNHNKDGKPTVAPALMVKKKINNKEVRSVRSFIASTHRETEYGRDTGNLIAMFIIPDKSANKIFGDPKDVKLEIKSPYHRVTNKEFISLQNKTLYMISRYFVECLNKEQLIKRGIIDDRVILTLLPKSVDVPKSYDEITIDDSRILIRGSHLVTNKGIRKWKTTTSAYDIEGCPKGRDACYAILVSYVLGKEFGDRWYKGNK